MSRNPIARVVSKIRTQIVNSVKHNNENVVCLQCNGEEEVHLRNRNCIGPVIVTCAACNGMGVA